MLQNTYVVFNCSLCLCFSSLTTSVAIKHLQHKTPHFLNVIVLFVHFLTALGCKILMNSRGNWLILPAQMLSFLWIGSLAICNLFACTRKIPAQWRAFSIGSRRDPCFALLPNLHFFLRFSVLRSSRPKPERIPPQLYAFQFPQVARLETTGKFEYCFYAKPVKWRGEIRKFASTCC